MSSAWSYSSLKQFKTCPRQYHEVRVLKKYPREENDTQRYGTALHLAAEEFVKDGKPLPPEFAFLEPTLAALLRKRGRHLCEHKMGVRADGTACDFFAPDVWSRGVADLLIIDDEDMTAWVFDYKSGSDKYPDTDQLKLMALMVFAHFPVVRQVKGALLFVLKDTMAKYRASLEDVDAGWWYFRNDVAKLEAAHATGVWNPKQSGLCRKYCPVLDCEMNGKR